MFCEEFLGYPAKNFQQVCQNYLLKFCYNFVRKKNFCWRVNFLKIFSVFEIKNCGFWRKSFARVSKTTFDVFQEWFWFFLKKQLTIKHCRTLSEKYWSTTIKGMPGCWNCTLHISRKNVRKNSFFFGKMEVFQENRSSSKNFSAGLSKLPSTCAEDFLEEFCVLQKKFSQVFWDLFRKFVVTVVKTAFNVVRGIFGRKLWFANNVFSGFFSDPLRKYFVRVVENAFHVSPKILGAQKNFWKNFSCIKLSGSGFWANNEKAESKKN